MSLKSSPAPSLVALLIVLSASAASLRAGTISLAWDAVVHEDLAGYRIYYGTSPDALNQTIDTGLMTEATLPGLADCTTYHVAVKAVDQSGLESPSFSNVVAGWARPEIASAAPATIERGSAVQLVVQGSNFQAGATVQMSNAGVIVGGVTYEGCSLLRLELIVDAAAATGPVDVQVVNPDHVFGSGAALFEIIEDGSGPLISDPQAASVGSTTATVTWSTDEPADSQVFFREGGDSSYQATALSHALVDSHAVELTGLVPGTAYEYYVRSADGAGNVSTADGAGFTTETNGFAYLRIEAESVSAAPPLESHSGAEAFDDAWVSLAEGAPAGSPSNPAGSWNYGFHLTSAGEWRLWFRIRGDSSDADGWLEGVDGSALAVVEATQAAEWEWVAGRSHALDAGLHTLTLGGYEAGASLDRVLLTDDPDFLPSEQPGDDVTAPSPVAALAAAALDSAVALSWTNPSDQDLSRVVVCFRTDGRAPAHPLDGWPLLDSAASPGGTETLGHDGLTNGLVYHYAVFALDGAGNVARPAAAQAAPEAPAEPLAEVENLRRTDVVGY